MEEGVFPVFFPAVFLVCRTVPSTKRAASLNLPRIPNLLGFESAWGSPGDCHSEGTGMTLWRWQSQRMRQGTEQNPSYDLLWSSPCEEVDQDSPSTYPYLSKQWFQTLGNPSWMGVSLNRNGRHSVRFFLELSMMDPVTPLGKYWVKLIWSEKL